MENEREKNRAGVPDRGEVNLERKRNTSLARRQEPTALALETLQDAMQLAEWAADSDLVPKDYRSKPANCLIAFQMGAEVGMHPLQALQSIAVINGRGAFYGDAVLAIARSSSVWSEKHFKEWTTGTFPDNDYTHHCQIGRIVKDGSVRIAEESFSVEDAKRAGLWNRRGRDGQPTPWVQYPKRMMTFRPRNFVLRDNFGDVLKGMPIVEDLQDVEEAEWEPVDGEGGEQEKPASRVEQMKQRLAQQKGDEDEKPAEAPEDDEPAGVDKETGEVDETAQAPQQPAGTDDQDNGTDADQPTIFDQVEASGDDRRTDLATLGELLKVVHLADEQKFARACQIILGTPIKRRSHMNHQQVINVMAVLTEALERSSSPVEVPDFLWMCEAFNEDVSTPDAVEKAWTIYADEADNA